MRLRFQLALAATLAGPTSLFAQEKGDAPRPPIEAPPAKDSPAKSSPEQASPASTPAPASPDAKPPKKVSTDAKIRQTLETLEVSVDFDQVPLDEVLDTLRSLVPFEIEVDPEVDARAWAILLKVKRAPLGTLINVVLGCCDLGHEVKDGVFRIKKAPPPPPAPKNPLVDAALASVDSATVVQLSAPRITLEVDRFTLAETLVLLEDVAPVRIELDPSVDGETKWGGEGKALSPAEVLTAICKKHGLVVKTRDKRLVLAPRGE